MKEMTKGLRPLTGTAVDQLGDLVVGVLEIVARGSGSRDAQTSATCE